MDIFSVLKCRTPEGATSWNELNTTRYGYAGRRGVAMRNELNVWTGYSVIQKLLSVSRRNHAHNLCFKCSSYSRVYANTIRNGHIHVYVFMN